MEKIVRPDRTMQTTTDEIRGESNTIDTLVKKKNDGLERATLAERLTTKNNKNEERDTVDVLLRCTISPFGLVMAR